MAHQNREFELRGLNHLALVCSDMKRTVEFYTQVLGMPLVKTVELPGGGGQHFFFDAGGGQSLAFFWFPSAPKAAPGVASPRECVGLGADPAGPGDFVTAHASMNHVAFDVPREKLEEYRARLEAKGVRCSAVYDHDDSPIGMGPRGDDTTWIRSVYFMDPDGIMLEFASWTRAIGQEGDVRHEPKTAADAAGS
jgi:catechol 2,3-dioxygenase-like lactoylglutathione lyase family enzyme